MVVVCVGEEVDNVWVAEVEEDSELLLEGLVVEAVAGAVDFYQIKYINEYLLKYISDFKSNIY